MFNAFSLLNPQILGSIPKHHGERRRTPNVKRRFLAVVISLLLPLPVTAVAQQRLSDSQPFAIPSSGQAISGLAITVPHLNDMRVIPTACQNATLFCGHIEAGELGPSDCTFSSDGTYFDVWTFTGVVGTVVDIDVVPVDATLTSTLVALVPPAVDASKTPLLYGSGKVHLTYVLSSTGTWGIGVGTHELSAHGKYTVRLRCSTDTNPTEPQNCVEQTLTSCPETLQWYLTASGCRFSDGGGPFQYLDFQANAAGDAFDFSVLSEFTPGVGVYAFAGGAPLIFRYGEIGSSSAAVYFIAPATGWYYALVTGRQSNSAGFFQLSTSCVYACAAPTITTSPQSQSTTATTVALSVAALGTPPLHYQWYAGVAPDTSKPIGTDTASLTVDASVTPATWTRVSNACGRADSSTAFITYVCSKPAITAQPVGGTVNFGGSFSVSVAATGTPPLHFQWFEGAPGSGVSIENDSPNITVSNILVRKSLWVRVSNSCGTTDSTEAIVEVNTSRHRGAKH